MVKFAGLGGVVKASNKRGALDRLLARVKRRAEEEFEVPELDERYARLVVRRPDKVRVLHRLDLSLSSEKLPDGFGGVFQRPVGTISAICADIPTITGGRADATDGAICIQIVDDPPPLSRPSPGPRI